MADLKLRSVNTHFWDDKYITKLDPIEKLLFLYLLTNPLTNLAGIYEITYKRMGFDTGIEPDMVAKVIKRFSRDNKVFYRDGYIIVTNFRQHQNYNPSMENNVHKVLDKLPQKVLDFIEKIKEIKQPVNSLSPECGQVEYKDKEEGEIEDKGKKMKDEILLEKFQAFWKLYPRKDDKKATQIKFNKLNPDDEMFSGMMQALQNQIQAGMYEDKKYTPMPSTWLSKERWNNEIIIKGKTDGIYSKHITEDKLRKISEDIANDTDLQR